MKRGENSEYNAEEYVERTREKILRPVMGNRTDEVLFFVGREIPDYDGNPGYDVYIVGKMKGDMITARELFDTMEGFFKQKNKSLLDSPSLGLN